MNNNVVSFEAKRQEHIEKHKELEMTAKCRNLNALISELSLVVSKHVNLFSAPQWQRVSRHRPGALGAQQRHGLVARAPAGQSLAVRRAAQA